MPSSTPKIRKYTAAFSSGVSTCQSWPRRASLYIATLLAVAKPVMNCRRCQRLRRYLSARAGGGRLEVVLPGVVAQRLTGRDSVTGQVHLGGLGGAHSRASGAGAGRATDVGRAAALQAAGAAVQAARLRQVAGRAQASTVGHSGELMVCGPVRRPIP